jgi:hypothetical protein
MRVILSPELAVSTIAALAGLWQVYVAKRVGGSGRYLPIKKTR